MCFGDVRDRARLVEAGIHDACALIAAADQDMVNVEVALVAKGLRADLPVVVRLFNRDLVINYQAAFRKGLRPTRRSAPVWER